MTFFINYGAEFSGDSVGTPEGGLLRAGEIERPKLQCQALDPRPRLLWFDPQFYLLSLRVNAGRSIRLIRAIDTYSWFGLTEREQASGEFSLQQQIVDDDLDHFTNLWEHRQELPWDQVVKGTVKLQKELRLAPGMTILPMPLIADPASNLDEEWRMLDEAIEKAREYEKEKPLIASIPIADSYLIHRNPLENDQLEVIVENLAVRADKLAGVYIPLIQVQDARDRLCDENIVGSLLRLARLFGAKTNLKAVFNFTESLGAICKSFGAWGYATGYAIRHRRFTLKDYEKTSGPKRFPPPKFFSLKMGVDLRAEDLEVLAKADALEMLASDETPSSASLFAGLRAKAPVADILEWAPGHNTYQTGKIQYFEQQMRLNILLSSPNATVEWLEEAKAQWNSVRRILKESSNFQFASFTNGEHLDIWLSAANSVLAESL